MIDDWDDWIGVYIIGPVCAQQPVKVGVAADPWVRLKSIQTGSPDRLDVIEIYGCESRREAMILEREFHEAHAMFRLAGEWFAVGAEEANYWLFRKTVIQP